MRIFRHRRDEEYLRVLHERLTIDGPAGLRANSVKMLVPFQNGDRTFTHCCRIDFGGIAATNLFDAGHNVVPSSASDTIEQLFRDVELLNKDGIFVKFRLLLVYPYSTHAISRMQAELSRNRSSMKQPMYARDFRLVESVDEDLFKQSQFVRAQSLMLEQIQDLIETYGWSTMTTGKTGANVNRVYIRFAPVSPNLCLLFVNDTIFTDAYLLSKEQRETKRLAHLAPLVQIDRDENPEMFIAYDDHFRYLWDLDVTIYADDATYYQPGRHNSLKQIKSPDKITFENKAAYIRHKASSFSDEEVQKWRFKVTRLLNRLCSVPAPTPSSESLFITCSWEKRKDGRAVPNLYAQELSRILETDFGRLRSDPLLSVHIMEGVAGEFLTRQLYARLEESTLAMIIMTGDVEGKDGDLYCKPNVYHELGFLMKHIGSERVILVCEEGITIPSNIQDVIRVDFSAGKLVLAYREILRWLSHSCSFGRKTVQEALRQHESRLNASVVSGLIDHSEAHEALRKIEVDLDTLSSGEDYASSFEDGRWGSSRDLDSEKFDQPDSTDD